MAGIRAIPGQRGARLGGFGMEIKIHARDLEITARAESYIQKKFDRLERHLSQISYANF